MKLSKKLLAAFSVAAMLVTALSVTGCKKDDDDDDPVGAISGWNNSYKLSYDNSNGYGTETDSKSTAAGVYRAWKRTNLKHLGALVKVTLQTGKDTEKAGKNSGVMGFAWDLQGNSDSDSATETFNLVGVRNNNGQLQAYVSRYYNVSNKLALNFGATDVNVKKLDSEDFATIPTVASELDVSNGIVNVTGYPEITGNEAIVWIDVAAKPKTADEQKKCGTVRTRATSEYTSAAIGSWVIAIYNVDPENLVETGTAPLKVFVIPGATDSRIGSGYAETANESKGIQAFDMSKSQKRQAVYANIYKGHTLKGEWKYPATYKFDEVVEE